MNQSFDKPWRLTWRPEHIARFWDWASSTSYMKGIYFSRLVGDSLLRIGRPYLRPGARVVDFGCGSGDLMEKLLERGCKVHGIDLSEDSLAVVRQRYKDRPGFLGCTNAAEADQTLPHGSFDVVLLIEAVEHMPDDALLQTLTTITHLLKPGGVVMITTPNDEVLAASEVFCPNCGCVFHKMQHVRSWSAQTLAKYVNDHAFSTISCGGRYLSDKKMPYALLQLAWRRFRYRKPLNLVYLGRKLPSAA